MKKLYIASDHAGFELKESLSALFTEHGIVFEDLGAHSFEPADDYPDLMGSLARAVAGEADSMGIAIGGSGQGEAIVANRTAGVRAAVYYGGNVEIVKLSREHNNANVLSLGARFMSQTDAKEAVMLWLKTDFSNEERHLRRINKIDHV